MTIKKATMNVTKQHGDTRVTILVILLEMLVLNQVVLHGEGCALVPDDPETYPLKPPNKIIKSEDGSIIDCVDFYSQPAFRDRILREQYKKDNMMEYYFSLNENNTKYNLYQHYKAPLALKKDGGCPYGSIPIRRSNTKFSQHPRRETIHHKGVHHSYSMTGVGASRGKNKHMYALIRNMGKSGYTFRGAKVTMSIWKPKVSDPEGCSVGQMWVSRGDIEQYLTSIEAGWEVYPYIYGDEPHLFIYFTNDNYKNVRATNQEGNYFVQTNPYIHLGQALVPSRPGRIVEHQFEFEQDSDGKWNFKFDGAVVGHFPPQHVSRLVRGATTVDFGGEVMFKKKMRVEMGSGEMPMPGNESRSDTAAYFGDAQLIVEDKGKRSQQPSKDSARLSDPQCYNLLPARNHDENLGQLYYYGGPGEGRGDCRA